jgi:GDP-4-dehydro-6-deoxy-D-mannose reductase
VRALLTGASGFLGRRLAARLKRDGFTVAGVCLDRLGLPESIPIHAVDVRDAAGLARVVAAESPDVVVHLAALAHVGESWRRMPEYFAINVLGTENVVAAARGRRLLFVSSAEVYGAVPEDEQPIDERRALAPRSPYALTKAAAERLALAAGAVVARCFNLVGAGQTRSFALPSFAAQLAAIGAGRVPPVLKVGNLTARRDFVHVEDGVEALALLVERGVAGEVYNVASGRALSIAEALERLVRVSGLEVTLEEDPERLRPVDVPLLCGDSGRLRALGWCDRHGFDAAIEELWCEAAAAAATA